MNDFLNEPFEYSKEIEIGFRTYRYNFKKCVVEYVHPSYGWRECRQMNHIDEVKKELGINRY